MNKQELIQRIRAAFSTANVPDPAQVVNGCSGEAIGVKALLIGKVWTNLLPLELIRDNAALGYLTDEAFRYYLPAYMMLLLDDLVAADLLASSLIRHLTLPTEADTLRLMNALAHRGLMNESLDVFLREEIRASSVRVGAFIRKMSGFTADQGKTINQFLTFLDQYHGDYFDEGEAAIASERYWFQYGV